MAAYLIANITVHDAEQYQDYVANVPALIEKHGGRYCVRGGDPEVLEGGWTPSRFIVLEFPNREAAMALYSDPEYQPYKSLRQSVTDSSLIVVDGHQ